MNSKEVDDAYERAARIVEQPYQCVAHSFEDRVRSRVVNQLAREIRALKTPQPKRERRLK